VRIPFSLKESISRI